jgi:sugar lactone lactonase YvrE
LADGPVWDAEAGILTWVDILEGALHAWNPSSDERRVQHLPDAVGAAVPRSVGGWVCGVGGSIAVIDQMGASLQWLVRDALVPTLRFNDAAADSSGRLWLGSVDRAHQRSAGALHVLEPGGKLATVVEGMGLANGIGFAPDGSEVFVADSIAHTLTAYRLIGGGVRQGAARLVVAFDQAGGMPDGVHVDEEGAIWVARFRGGCVERYSPSGAMLERVDVPALQPTGVTIGGPSPTALVVTSASEYLPATDREDPWQGAVLAIDVGVHGGALGRFGA